MAYARPRTGRVETRGGSSAPGSLIINLAILVVVVLAVGTAALLLARTVSTAQNISTKADNIAKNGRGINGSTDSIVQLNRTNELAMSILRSAQPLDRKVGAIAMRAQTINGFAGSINGRVGTINGSATAINGSALSINSSAGSINGSAGTINGTAKDINSTAGAINGTAGSISGLARSINSTATTINGSARSINGNAGSINGTASLIDRDAAAINRGLDSTIALARKIKVDSGNILDQAKGAIDTAACIDKKLEGGDGDVSDCKGLGN